MSSITTPVPSSGGMPPRLERAFDEIDQRFHPAAGLRRQFNKVFPTHWSFMLGEIALYSFIVLLLSGTYLALFFDPSMTDVTYNGVFDNLRGVHMSRAYESAVQISLEVRGGLFVRQVHHWAALLFVAAMVVHMCRIFFTGAFRKPRETNWLIGIVLLFLGFIEGFTGYSLPDDLLSGTGLRIASGFILSIPIIGTWIHWALFGGEFPGTEIIPRLYIVHVLLIPGILLALIAIHLGLVWYQKHTQFPGLNRTEGNVVGVRILPAFAAKGGAFFALTTGVLAMMGGLIQINPIWNFGPYAPAQISAGSQPDWYVLFTEGMLRIFPPWEIYLFGHYTIPPAFWASPAFLPVLYVLAAAYPAIERRFTKDDALHNLLQRPRDAPVRTGLGIMGLSFYLVLVLSGINDWIAYFFHVSLNATTWAGRIGVLIVPPIAYWVTYRICIGLQRADREVLEHGIETGIIKRLPHGEFIEVHQPLAGVDEHGHAIPLGYQGTPVPKKLNQLGMGGAPVPGSLLRPDPVDQTLALERARAEQAEAETAHPEEIGAAPTTEHAVREPSGRPTSGTD
ncbi:cytochrome b [Pseudonocardia acidicola]|uniref:Cytochrome bc1 complex cytochrome b subunit n=1 Tax=Pseudonocardia acidicola TaxID=2724939 RepID=A0ABX1SLH4_9PSEU|nr:ubiquinol-cytochrome c reductase cytochrome b subunit [Pseudonocardia acidicola]NMI01911.1 ubiquinol-cytochrome c reductase cytochrome b subunit [Pseudonocardia acidicola]